MIHADIVSEDIGITQYLRLCYQYCTDANVGVLSAHINAFFLYHGGWKLPQCVLDLENLHRLIIHHGLLFQQSFHDIHDINLLISFLAFSTHFEFLIRERNIPCLSKNTLKHLCIQQSEVLTVKP